MSTYSDPAIILPGAVGQIELDATAKKSVASGVAPLDAGSKVPTVNLPDMVPSGCIMMWHGLIANIPSGYVICDGLNSTPNLQATFVRGAPAATEAGTTGGADTHVLDVTEIPAHTHTTYAYDTGNTTAGHTGGLAGGVGRASAATGGGLAHNNMPAYYEIIFIMKS